MKKYLFVFPELDILAKDFQDAELQIVEYIGKNLNKILEKATIEEIGLGE